MIRRDVDFDMSGHRKLAHARRLRHPGRFPVSSFFGSFSIFGDGSMEFLALRNGGEIAGPVSSRTRASESGENGLKNGTDQCWSRNANLTLPVSPGSTSPALVFTPRVSRQGAFDANSRSRPSVRRSRFFAISCETRGEAKSNVLGGPAQTSSPNACRASGRPATLSGQDT